MGARGRSSKRTIWRNALAFLAAYLLVIQAALAGVAMERMQAGPDQSLHVICLNGESGAQDDGKAHPAPFDCCGVGCLVGSHSLQSPSSPDQALTYPAFQSYSPSREARSATLGFVTTDGPRPRGPPAAV